jgi:hypothetical protein
LRKKSLKLNKRPNKRKQKSNIMPIYRKKKKKSFWKRLEKEKKLKKKLKVNSKSSFLDFKRWRTKCWLDPKLSKLRKSNKNNLRKLKKSFKRKRKFNKN